MIENYLKLASLGDRYTLDFKLKKSTDFVRKTEEIYNYVKYNPRKEIKRYGLSITSLDGGVSGIPDLDSLLEYNKEHNTQISEKDCNVPTMVAEECVLKKFLEPFKDYLFRSHILRIDPGGYFPAHRDVYRNIDSFRLISPLSNCDPPYMYFILDGTITTNWDLGRMYFVNTIKEHTLFNASFNPSYWLVLNVDLNNVAVETVLHNLSIR
jgi:hypothetical protein